MRDNTDQRKSVFRYISRSVLQNIIRHNLDLRKNINFVTAQKLFVHEYMICLTVRKLKVQK